jgi:hypothetical protein
MSSPLELYEDVWSSVSMYGEHSPGEANVSVFLDMTKTTMRTHVLDAGCGSGKGALALKAAGFDRVEMCDITDVGLVPEARGLYFSKCLLWEATPGKVGFHDWVYCCDVMEHIPPALTMLVVDRLLAIAKRGVFFSISFQPDVMGFFVGKPLHETVMPFQWWRDQLALIGTLVEARDMLHYGCFLVKPR